MSSSSGAYDLSFKILLIGDSGVGKSSLLVSFISNSLVQDDLPPTIGNTSHFHLLLTTKHHLFVSYVFYKL